MEQQFRDLLNAVFLERKRKNKRYSLRGFAYSLGIDASQLSKILKGKLRPAPATIEKILPKLSLDEASYRVALGSLEEMRRKKKERYQIGKSDFFTPDSSEEWPFESVDELIVFVALSMPDLSSNLGHIQQVLSMEDERFIEIVMSLEKKKMVKIRKGDVERVVRQVADSPSLKPSLNKRALQKEFLSLASESLESVVPDRRLNGTLTFSLDQRLLPNVKNKIDTFLRELNGWIMAESSKMDAVYNFTVALYPLSKESEKKS